MPASVARPCGSKPPRGGRAATRVARQRSPRRPSGKNTSRGARAAFGGVWRLGAAGCYKRWGEHVRAPECVPRALQRTFPWGSSGVAAPVLWSSTFAALSQRATGPRSGWSATLTRDNDEWHTWEQPLIALAGAVRPPSRSAKLRRRRGSKRGRAARRPSPPQCSALLGCSVGLHDGALLGARRRGLARRRVARRSRRAARRLRAACARPPGVKFANWLVTRMITLRL